MTDKFKQQAMDKAQESMDNRKHSELKNGGDAYCFSHFLTNSVSNDDERNNIINFYRYMFTELVSLIESELIPDDIVLPYEVVKATIDYSTSRVIEIVNGKHILSDQLETEENVKVKPFGELKAIVDIMFIVIIDSQEVSIYTMDRLLTRDETTGDFISPNKLDFNNLK